MQCGVISDNDIGASEMRYYVCYAVSVTTLLRSSRIISIDFPHIACGVAIILVAYRRLVAGIGRVSIYTVLSFQHIKIFEIQPFTNVINMC